MTKNYRWRILALLFLATTINCVDRQVLAFVMTDEGFKTTILGLSPGTVLSGHTCNSFASKWAGSILHLRLLMLWAF